MRRFFKLILPLTLGFGIGMASSELRLRVETVPYCQVARNADWYHNRFIRVRARLIFGTGGLYVYEDCDPIEALASKVEFEGADETVGAGYVEEVLVTGEKPHIKTADAIIEGTFDAYATSGCWAPKYRINARSIKLISDASNYTVEAR